MKFVACLAAGALLAGSAHAATNLIVNGDFESGNTGFTSDHTYVDPTASALFPEGLFTIGSNPLDVHPYWTAMLAGDNMMIVNGMTGGGLPVVWQQSVEVDPGSYAFSAQAANVCCNSSFTGVNASSNLLFQYSFDGVNFTTFSDLATNPPGDAGSFYTVNGAINSDSHQTLTLRIANGVTAASGNDFALDKISLIASTVPEPEAWALMIAGFGLAGMALRVRRSRPALA
jgi:hypothetical protein